MTSTRWSDDTARARAVALRRRTVERRREALENLRRLSVQLEAASTLDRRAEHSNPVLAALLRDRAEERRRIADFIRAHLDGWDQAPAGTSPAAMAFSRWILTNRHQ